MIPELGTLALAVSCGLAILLMVLPVMGIHNQHTGLIRSARPLTYAMFVCVLFAMFLLICCLVSNDFSVAYVANHSNSQLPVYYRIAAAWGGHEGSLLLWSFLLSTWTLFVALSNRKIDEKATAYVLSVIGFVNLGFLLFIVLASNPFARALPYFPMDGADLNPMLQDVGLIFHPPLLYMGYVGFSIAFAFSIAALLCGRFDTQWIRWCRPWILVAWIFLTLGILLGSYWAYYELGWGGWWFWDPVENASLMPWITGTALLHSLSVAEKRGSFKIWTLLLSITTFSLCLMGTFLVRSGILVSVHTFSSAPSRGVFILLFLLVVIGGSLLLFALKSHKIRNTVQEIFVFSKEGFIIAGNILLLSAMLVVMLGTLWPIVYKEILNLGSISIGAPYFNEMFCWLLIPVVLLIGVAPLMRWQKDQPIRVTVLKDGKPFGRWQDAPSVRIDRLCYIIFPLSIILAFATSYLLSPKIRLWQVIGLFMVFWIVLFSIYTVYLRLKANRAAGADASPINTGFWGMILAHLGVAAMIFGVSLSHYNQIERHVKMTVGEDAKLGQYSFVFKEISELDGPNYHGFVGRFDVMLNSQRISVLFPEKRIYRTSKMPMTEAAVSSSLTRDLYVALSEELAENIWAVRLYHKPFICWIWLGALFMAAGGGLAILDRRNKIKKTSQSSSINTSKGM